MTARHHKKQSVNKKQALYLLGTIVLAVAAVLIFLYRDSISGALSPDTEDGKFTESEAYTFETGSRQFFSLAGDKLVIASSTGLQVLNSKGETLTREVFSMTNPAVSKSAASCAVFDIGGRALRVYKDGECRDLGRDYPIISAQLNSSDYLAVSEQESGYKGAVTVLDAEDSAIYEWYSGTGYVVDAAVSPDCSMLAVLCVESSGSVVHVFKLDSEEEYFSLSVPGELGFRLNYFKNGGFCLLSEKALHFFSGTGKELSAFPFDGNYLAGFELSDELCAVVLSKYVSGSEVSLISFDFDGDESGKVALTEEPVSMFVQKQKLLVLCSDSVTVFSRELRTLDEGHVVAGYKGAVLTPKNNVFLLTSHYAEECKMK